MNGITCTVEIVEFVVNGANIVDAVSMLLMACFTWCLGMVGLLIWVLLRWDRDD
jgi:hypothetical protein